MRSKHPGMVVLDHVIHVLWQMCAVVGIVTIPWVPGGADEVNRLALPLAIGLAFGLLTMPVVLRSLRPALERRFPWAFGE